MRKLPPRRLNAIGAALATTAAEATFQQQLREANLKMPIKDAMGDLAVQMQQHLDAELKKAIERFLGFEVTDPEQVKGRLSHIQTVGSEVTYYQMDGTPILKAGQQVLERQGEAIHAFQLVEQMLPEGYVPAARGGIITA